MQPEIIDGNPGETECDHSVFADAPAREYLDHLDVMLHDLVRKVDELHAALMPHAHLIERGAALLDPAARLRGMLPGAGHAKRKNA